jgi:ribosomal-protein-alanine N-acetyltransferase
MIREATPTDRSRLRAIQLASLEEPWGDLLEPAIEGPPVTLVVTDEESHDVVTDRSERTESAPGDVVGYAVAIPEGAVAYVAEIAVAPPHRGVGHGSALMAALLDRLAADGFERARLTVRETDRRAREFYGDHGFVVRSLLPCHYEEADGLLLVCPLGTD